ncbi:PIN domain nuclease, partial [Salinicoccus roseus]
IQKELDITVEIYEGDFEDIQEVDSKLVKLAKLTSGVDVTNDFNLNKVCELQKVAVLNINDLANAVKPVVLPGEEMNVQVIKDGKEHYQGVAYLD